jgi:hypothetical protein
MGACRTGAPETSVHGNQAELRLSLGSKIFVVIFGCRKKKWSLRRIEVRRGEETATFDHGELANAIAALVGHEPLAPAPCARPAPWAVKVTSGPRTDAVLRERRTTVIRT